jgi:hypothetical protein
MLRASELLFAASALAMTSCPPPAPPGPAVELAAEQLFGSKLNLKCPAIVPHAGLGLLRGCWGKRADTTVYLYYNNSGEVLSYGRYWSVNADRGLAIYDSLAQVLTATHGHPVLTCELNDPAWVVKDQRWGDGPLHRAVILSIPTKNLGVEPSLRTVTQAGSPDCADRFLFRSTDDG